MTGWGWWSIGNVQGIEIQSYEQILYAQHRISPWRCDAKISLGFWDINGSHNLGKKSGTSDIKKKSSWMDDFAIPVEPRLKFRENKKEKKAIEPCLGRQKSWNLKHDTNCHFCFGYSNPRIGMRTGGLGNKRTCRDHPNYNVINIDQNSEKVLDTCCHSKSRKKLPANAGVKNCEKSKIIIIYEQKSLERNEIWEYVWTKRGKQHNNSSSSSCRAGSTDIPDPLSPLLPFLHRPWQVFRTASRILT